MSRLPIIVIAQILCTAPWFGGNAVLPELTRLLALPPSAVGWMTSAVQLGFICGTLLFALTALADRVRASRLFFVCAAAVAAVNAAIPLCKSYEAVLSLRFMTGILLAGIYPVGMKIAAEQFPQGLGKALGYLVGALVLGTALPHGLRALALSPDPSVVLYLLSAGALAGGLLMLLLVPSKAALPTTSGAVLKGAFALLRLPSLRAAAFGYFGHMWELYALWTFIPLLVAAFVSKEPSVAANIPAWSFFTIASGAIGCAVAGHLSNKGSAKLIAAWAMAGSAACCIALPFVFRAGSPVFFPFLLLWGALVVADSPMFSTLVAQFIDPARRGSALTLVTSIGFAVTIGSIELLNRLRDSMPTQYLPLLLAPGPILGLLVLRRGERHSSRPKD